MRIWFKSLTDSFLVKVTQKVTYTALFLSVDNKDKTTTIKKLIITAATKNKNKFRTEAEKGLWELVLGKW